jgi:tRNA threonylcarbamoyladenosine biosynthesis protein TsaE
MKTVSIKSLSELPSAAKAILDFAGDKKIFCFYGELGAGKTTLIKELCKQLGVKDAGSSPTFSLVNEYSHPTPRSPQRKEGQSEIPNRTISSPSGRAGGILYHFDLYRLKNESEIYDIGYEDYIFSGNYCFIEWPEKIEKLLPKDIVKVSIQVNDSERVITVE